MVEQVLNPHHLIPELPVSPISPVTPTTKAGSYSMAAWTSAAFVTALPGIIIQLVLIPILVDRLKKANLF